MFSRTIRQSDATSNLWMQQSSARPNSSLHAISSQLAGIRISDHTYITMGDAATKWYQHCRRQSPRLNAPGRKGWPNHIFKAETHCKSIWPPKWVLMIMTRTIKELMRLLSYEQDLKSLNLKRARNDTKFA